MVWIELPFLNKAELCKMAGVDATNLSKKLSGKVAFTPADLAQLDALQKSLPIQIMRAKKVTNKPKVK